MKARESIILHAEPEKVWPYLFEPEKVLQSRATLRKILLKFKSLVEA